jgi:hypothetical protein
MEEEPTTTAAAADVDVPVEEETLLEAEERLATAEEETLPKERPAQEQEADPAAAPGNIQVPTWNLDERIPIAPQVWDADTQQIGVGAAGNDVEVVNLEDSEPTPIAPEPPRISPKEKRIGRRKMPAHRKKKGRSIIRLTETSSAQTVKATKDERRPNRTADNFGSQPVHNAQEEAVLATEVASVQRQEDPVLGTEEVRSTDGREPVPAPVGTPEVSRMPAAQETRNPTDTERETAPLSPQSSPASTAARRMSATRPVHNQQEEILALLGVAMEWVRTWNGQEEA